MIIDFNKPDNQDKNDPSGDRSGDASDNSDSLSDNSGTLILDATCAPQNIEFLQDINLLNEAREKLKELVR